MLLSDISVGKSCIIVKVNGHGAFRQRVLELGFVKGQVVKVVKKAPLQDPIEYKLLNSYISLRNSEAKQIEVVDIGDSIFFEDSAYYGTLSEETKTLISKSQKTINVALVGNPNCGKTSLFNEATGGNEKVGNYGGVTVDAKIESFESDGYTFNFIDLPGTYSITEYSPEERYVRKYLLESDVDVVLNVIDSTNLERNMYLTTQLIDMNFKMVAALNIFDDFEKNGNILDYQYLGEMLGFPFVPTIAKDGKGISTLITTIIDVFEDRDKTTKDIHINYGEKIENAITEIKLQVQKDKPLADKYSSRYLAIKGLQGDKLADEILSSSKEYSNIAAVSEKMRQKIVRSYNDDISTVLTNLKYGFIRGALKETFKPAESKAQNMSEKIDNVLTNRWLGFPILVFFMWLMFQATFYVGAYPQDWIEQGFGLLGEWVSTVMPEGWANDLIVSGVIGGVGGVIVFLPNILILFFFIALMEDTGYMARATFVMDRLMHKIGLHGRSFIPLVSGFGCSVPAIMATRTLENKKDRLLTMLIIPFMSCSAKLPVYILFVSMFFTKYQGLILLTIYIIGAIIGVISALVLKNTMFRKEKEQFVLELPAYRMISLKATLGHMWDRSSEYLKKMATVILGVSILIWALQYFPRSSAGQIELSYIGQIGKYFEPLFVPLGYGWELCVALLTGFAAKETIVATLEILNPTYSLAAAYSFMMFILLYTPCFATVITCAKEASKKWAIFMISYTFAIAWIVSFLVYRIAIFFM